MNTTEEREKTLEALHELGKDFLAYHKAEEVLLEEETPVTVDGIEFAAVDELHHHVLGRVLSVEVRGGWTSVADEAVAEEFRVTFALGGPTIRLYGSLNDGAVPGSLYLKGWWGGDGDPRIWSFTPDWLGREAVGREDWCSVAEDLQDAAEWVVNLIQPGEDQY